MAGEPLPADSGLVHGWGAVQILPDLLSVLDGTRALRIRDLQAAAPLEYEGMELADPDPELKGNPS